jgi:hypothetical protein
MERDVLKDEFQDGANLLPPHTRSITGTIESFTTEFA